VGYFNTFAASPVAAMVGQAVLEVIEHEGLMANAARVGDYLMQRLKGLSAQHPLISEVRGAGLYIGVELVRPLDGAPATALAGATVNAMRDRQVLIGVAGKSGNVLKLRPPLCFTQADADQLASALDDSLKQMH
jgi:4-aminobutyrate aminotransferase-like enzyme